MRTRCGNYYKRIADVGKDKSGAVEVPNDPRLGGNSNRDGDVYFIYPTNIG